MNTRRKFLFQGGMATTALLASKPFETLANAMSPLTGFTPDNNKVVFAHTGDHFGTNLNATLKNIEKLKKNTGNLVLVHAGNVNEDHAAHQCFDMMIKPGHSFSVNTNEYKIIHKGNVKIGIITAVPDETGLVERINSISSWLKKEKNCQLVACISQLGYTGGKNIDDVTLAERSAYLDIIIGGHAENFCKSPVTVKNKNNEAVIINHAAGEELALRKIEIGFTASGKKKHIAFTRSVPLGQSALSS